METKVELKSVFFSYEKGDNIALKEVDLRLKSPCLVGLIGKNGAGKTTLINLMAGVYKQDYGTITVGGKEPSDDLETKANIIVSNAEPPFPKWWKITKLIKYYKMSYDQFSETFATHLFEHFKVDVKKEFKQYSLGFQSIIKFILTIATRAEITLLDEPVIGMDLEVRKRVYQILLREYMNYPRMILISSHMMNEMEDILEYVVLVKNKTVAKQCDIDTFKEQVIRLDGSREALQIFAKGKQVLYTMYSELDNYIILKENGWLDKEDFKQSGLKPSRLKASEIFLYEMEEEYVTHIDSLWEEEVEEVHG